MYIDKLVGNTPIIKLNNIVYNECANIWAKLENLNSTGSQLERTALLLLNHIKNKENDTISTIVNASYGNFGVALASYCGLLGYKLIVVLPEFVNEELIQIINAFGGEVILTPRKNEIKEAIRMAQKLSDENDSYFFLNHFDNNNILNIDYKTTVHEIVNQLNFDINAFVCGIDSVSTITGIGLKLKENYPNIKIIGVQSDRTEIVDRDDLKSLREIYNTRSNYKPSNLNMDIIDEIFTVCIRDAIKYTKMLANKEGILVDINSGALLCTCLEISKKLGKDKQILTIFTDSGERYLSTGLYS